MRAGKGSGSDARSLRAATADGLGASSGREDGVVRSPGAAPHPRPPPHSPSREAAWAERAWLPRGARPPGPQLDPVLTQTQLGVSRELHSLGVRITQIDFEMSRGVRTLAMFPAA